MSGGTTGNVAITPAERAAEVWSRMFSDADALAASRSFLAGVEWARANPATRERTHDEWLKFHQRALTQVARRLDRMEKQLGLEWLDDSDIWRATT